MKDYKLKKLTIILLCSVFILISGLRGDSQKVMAESEDIYSSLKLFSNVLDIVEHAYVEEVDTKEALYGAINGMLSTLDPHSSFMTADEYKELKVETTGKFGGIGIEITIRNGILTIVAPIEGTPGEKAGLKAGDKILKVDNKLTKDMSIMQAVKRMRGKKGTKVVLTIMREGFVRARDFEITRGIIPIHSIRSMLLEDGYGYVRITNFRKETANDLENALVEFKKESGPLKGLVMDLRNNPGGLLHQAVQVSDLFLDSGLIVYTKGRMSAQQMRFTATPANSQPHYPIIIIVNEGSASASEIVAGALQDQKRAIVLGMQTFGKGSVQTIIPLDNGSGIRLTTAKYYTPSGRSIQAKGIVPDIIVSQARMDIKGEDKNSDSEQFFIREADLEHHFENDQTNKEDKTEGLKDDVKKLLKNDRQLNWAYRLLKSWDVFARVSDNIRVEINESK